MAARKEFPTLEQIKQAAEKFIQGKPESIAQPLKQKISTGNWVSVSADIALFCKENNQPTECVKWLSRAIDSADLTRESTDSKDQTKVEKIKFELAECSLTSNGTARDVKQAISLFREIEDTIEANHPLFIPCCERLANITVESKDIANVTTAYEVWIKFIFNNIQQGFKVNTLMLCESLDRFITNPDNLLPANLRSDFISNVRILPQNTQQSSEYFAILNLLKKMGLSQEHEICQRCIQSAIQSSPIPQHLTGQLKDFTLTILQNSLKKAEAKEEWSTDIVARSAMFWSQEYLFQVQQIYCSDSWSLNHLPKQTRGTTLAHYFQSLFYQRMYYQFNPCVPRDLHKDLYSAHINASLTQKQTTRQGFREFAKYLYRHLDLFPSPRTQITAHTASLELNLIYTGNESEVQKKLDEYQKFITKQSNVLEELHPIMRFNHFGFSYPASSSIITEGVHLLEKHDLHCHSVNAYLRFLKQCKTLADKTKYLKLILEHFHRAHLTLMNAYQKMLEDSDKEFLPHLEFNYFYNSFFEFYNNHKTILADTGILSDYHFTLSIWYPKKALTHLKNAYDAALEFSKDPTVVKTRRDQYCEALLKESSKESLLTAMNIGSFEAGMKLLQTQSLPTHERCGYAEQMLKVTHFDEVTFEKFCREAIPLFTKLTDDFSGPFFKNIVAYLMQQILLGHFKESTHLINVVQLLQKTNDMTLKSIQGFLAKPKPNFKVLFSNAAKKDLFAICCLLQLAPEKNNQLEKTSLNVLLLFLLSENNLLNNSFVVQLRTNAIEYLTSRARDKLAIFGKAATAKKIATWVIRRLTDITHANLKLHDLKNKKNSSSEDYEAVTFFLNEMQRFGLNTEINTEEMKNSPPPACNPDSSTSDSKEEKSSASLPSCPDNEATVTSPSIMIALATPMRLFIDTETSPRSKATVAEDIHLSEIEEKTYQTASLSSSSDNPSASVAIEAKDCAESISSTREIASTSPMAETKDDATAIKPIIITGDIDSTSVMIEIKDCDESTKRVSLPSNIASISTTTESKTFAESPKTTSSISDIIPPSIMMEVEYCPVGVIPSSSTHQVFMVLAIAASPDATNSHVTKNRVAKPSSSDSSSISFLDDKYASQTFSSTRTSSVSSSTSSNRPSIHTITLMNEEDDLQPGNQKYTDTQMSTGLFAIPTSKTSTSTQTEEIPIQNLSSLSRRVKEHHGA